MTTASLLAAKIKAFPLDLLDYGVVRPTATSGRPIVSASRPRYAVVTEGCVERARSENDFNLKSNVVLEITLKF